MIHLVILGASGDLTARLLMPALYRLEERKAIEDLRISGQGLEKWSREEFLRHIKKSLEKQVSIKEEVWTRLAEKTGYISANLSPDSLKSIGFKDNADTTVYYLALPPGLFPKAASSIAMAGLAESGNHRLVVEKPFGTDLHSARQLNEELHQHWDENLVFRIDHLRLHAEYGKGRGIEATAYEQLLLDVLEGDHTPFLRVDEVEEAWRILDPVLESWKEGQPEVYAAGTAGPSSQKRILLPGHTWRSLS